MAERPKFFDDLAGVAGGALSALSGVRDEAEALIRARIDEAIRHFDLVKREEVDAATEMAANARAGQEAASASLATALERIAGLERRIEKLEAQPRPGSAAAGQDGSEGGGPGMIA